MTAKLMHAMTRSVQDLSHEQTQLSVTEHRDLRVSRQAKPVPESRMPQQAAPQTLRPRRKPCRNNVQVGFRQCQKLTKCAGMPDDAQNLARWTVPAKTALAPIATPAREIDFSNNATSNKARIVRCDNFSDEFVPGSTGESVVTAKQVQDLCCICLHTRDGLPHSLPACVAWQSSGSRPDAFQSEPQSCGLAYHLRFSKSDGEDSMKAIRVHEFGPPAVMKLEDVPDPQPGARQLVVAVKAAGINPVDTYIRAGTYAKKPALPYTPGFDAAGIVESVGPEVRDSKSEIAFTSITTSVARMRRKLFVTRNPSLRCRIV